MPTFPAARSRPAVEGRTALRVRVRRAASICVARHRYYKGIGGGVKNWTATPDTFPAGLRAFHDYTRWPIVGHNRFWAPDTDYAKANGGKYAPADPTRPGPTRFQRVKAERRFGPAAQHCFWLVRAAD